MTKFPDDDERLVDFLRQHASAVPPAAPNLEQQVMAAVAASPHLPPNRRVWFVPTRCCCSNDCLGRPPSYSCL